MSTHQKLIRRYDRIRSVWQRTKSENTARRCECRMSEISRQARMEFAESNSAVLQLGGKP